MRLTLTLLACSLTLATTAAAQSPAAQSPVAPDSRRAAATANDSLSPAALRTRGDALRAKGDYAGALAAYEAERRAAGDSADVWKHIGWTEKALRRFSAAARALQRAVDLDPKDEEARVDLEALKVAHGLALETWVGGTEPGTSKHAVEGQASYSALNRVEINAGGSRTDNVFYESARGYANAYWFYSPDSYVKTDISVRKYQYSGANRPTPDSNAYDVVPRADIEVSSWVTRRARIGVDYQLFAPNFFFDPASRIVNHKVSTEITGRLGGGVTATVLAAVLRDPDPSLTRIKGRSDPTAPGTVAAATSVAYRSEILVGGGFAYDAGRWSAGTRIIPNRDLDSSFQWSTVSDVTVRPATSVSLNVQWVRDRYSTDAGPTFAGRHGDIWWGTSRWQIRPALAISAGVKWVANPGPKTTTTTTVNGIPVETRNDPTLLLNLQYRTHIF